MLPANRHTAMRLLNATSCARAGQGVASCALLGPTSQLVRGLQSVLANRDRVVEALRELGFARRLIRSGDRCGSHDEDKQD